MPIPFMAWYGHYSIRKEHTMGIDILMAVCCLFLLGWGVTQLKYNSIADVLIAGISVVLSAGILIKLAYMF